MAIVSLYDSLSASIMLMLIEPLVATCTHVQNGYSFQLVIFGVYLDAIDDCAPSVCYLFFAHDRQYRLRLEVFFSLADEYCTEWLLLQEKLFLWHARREARVLVKRKISIAEAGVKEELFYHRSLIQPQEDQEDEDVAFVHDVQGNLSALKTGRTDGLEEALQAIFGEVLASKRRRDESLLSWASRDGHRQKAVIIQPLEGFLPTSRLM